MLDISNHSRGSQDAVKSDKVETNLVKIRSLIQGALLELKKSERVSTDGSDSSETQGSEFIHRMSIDLHKQRTETILESLEKGYLMVKHSPNSKPKEKYVYISSDRRFLCWKSLEKDDEKMIELKKINLVLRGQEETICYVESKSIKTLERFVIVKSEVRNLQLEAFSVEESFRFQGELREAIRNAKGIHLSYQV